MAKGDKSERMVTAVPMHTIMLVRPTGKTLANDKDQYGDPKPEMRRMSPKVGEEFEFTESEVTDILKMSPAALRRPGNVDVDFVTGVDAAAAAAAATAIGMGAAPNDAVSVARTGAMGQGQMPNSSNSERGQPETTGDDDEDL